MFSSNIHLHPSKVCKTHWKTLVSFVQHIYRNAATQQKVTVLSETSIIRKLLSLCIKFSFTVTSLLLRVHNALYKTQNMPNFADLQSSLSDINVVCCRYFRSVFSDSCLTFSSFIWHLQTRWVDYPLFGTANTGTLDSFWPN